MMLFPNIEVVDDLPDGSGKVRHVKGWVPVEDRLRYLRALLGLSTYQQREVRVAGLPRPVLAPRLESWHGDHDVASYAYSGSKPFPRHSWTDELAELRQRVEYATGATYNAVLVNLYRNGQDSVAWHADDEATLGPSPTIASVSFGVSRRFLLRPKGVPSPGSINGHAVHRREDTRTYVLDDGDLLAMIGRMQASWEHSVPKMEGIEGSRINLTFRYYRPAAAWRRT